jgi:acetyl esterase/lipase
MQQIIDFLWASKESRPASGPSVEERRQSLDAMGGLFTPPPDVEARQLEVAGVPCEQFDPPNRQPGTLLHFHGGAYTAGSLDSHRAMSARLAAACGCRVIAVGYRLAPEHPFPAGLDDAYGVYNHLLGAGTDPSSVVLLGDSAGGGLATALFLRLRDEGGFLPSGGVLLSPWLDLTLEGESVSAMAAVDPMVNASDLTKSAGAYGGDRLREPRVSPIFGDFAGLPPFLVLVGSSEILLDDSRLFATRAQAQGVEVELDVEEGLIHVWPFLDGVPESSASMERIGSWVATRLQEGPLVKGEATT